MWHCHLVSLTRAGALRGDLGSTWFGCTGGKLDGTRLLPRAGGGGTLWKPALPLFTRANPTLIPSATGPALLPVHLLTSSTCRGKQPRKGQGVGEEQGRRPSPLLSRGFPLRGSIPALPRCRGCPAPLGHPRGRGGARCLIPPILPIPLCEAGAATNNPGIEEPPVRAHLQLHGPAEDKANAGRWRALPRRGRQTGLCAREGKVSSGERSRELGCWGLGLGCFPHRGHLPSYRMLLPPICQTWDELGVPPRLSPRPCTPGPSARSASPLGHP